MGYTHYFGPKSFKPAEFNSIVKASKEVIRIVTEEMKIPIVYEYDETDKPPVCEGELIRFNGADDDGHETFSLDVNNGRDFCKTARKPYDIAVTAVLCLAHHYGGLDVASDGDPEDWEDGLALAQRIEPKCVMPIESR